MKKNLKKILYLITLLLFIIEARGQTVDSVIYPKDYMSLRDFSMMRNNHVIGGDNLSSPQDSIEKMISKFYFDQFRHFQDPRAPYFMFLSKTGKLALGIGGQIKIRGYFDWNGSIPSTGFSPYEIEIPKNPLEQRNLSASGSGSGFFVTLLGNNSIFGDFMAYIQADFSGYNNRGFRLKKAYFSFRDWTLGYTTTTFEDTKAEPATVDGAGPNGINSRKNVLMRYMKTIKKNWVVAGSVEFPSQSITTDGVNTKECNTYLPDLAAFIQYQWNSNASHVRLSGLLRTLTYRDMLLMRNFNITGWGVQASSVINILPQLNFFGIASVGRGHASYTTDLGNGAFDLIPDLDNPGKLYAPMATGYVAGFQYFFTKNIFSNLVFSEQRYYPKTNPKDDQYKYGLYSAVNIFWDITPRVEIGVEYLYGKRKNFNRMSASADRILAMLEVSF